MRKFILIFVLLLMLALAGVSHASTPPITLYVGGEQLALQTPCKLIDGVVYTPIAALDSLYAKYEVGAKRKKDGRKVDINAANGKDFSCTARIVDDRLMLPICDIAPKMGAIADWNESTGNLAIDAQIQRIEFDGSELRVDTSFPVASSILDTNWTRTTNKLVLDISGAKFPLKKSDLAVGNKTAVSINTGYQDDGTARVVLTMSGPSKPRLISAAKSSHITVSLQEQTSTKPTPPQVDTSPTRPGGEISSGSPEIILPGQHTSPVTISGIEYNKVSSRHIEVYVSSSGEAKFSTSMTRRPDKLILDIKNAALEKEIADLSVESNILQDIRTQQQDENTVRIEMDLPRIVGFDVEWDGASSRYIVSLELPKGAGGLLSEKVIVIDPGHGGPWPGAIGCCGTLEKDCTLQIATQLQTQLAATGACVLMTRKGDTVLDSDRKRDLVKRATFASKHSADFFISIHCNSCIVKNTSSGTETYYHRGDENGRVLAECIHPEVVKAGGLINRKIRPDPGPGFVVLKTASNYGIPAVLVEVGFINHTGDESKLIDPEFQHKIAGGIVMGLKAYVEGGTGN